MYALLFLACLGHQTTCFEVIDFTGPYKTKTECIERASQLANEVGQKIKLKFYYQYKCVRQHEA
jgi:hypothetical protein